MGLDMYCKKIRKIPKEEIQSRRFENKMPMYFANLLAVSQEEIKEDEKLFYDILPYLTIVPMVASRINYDLVKYEQGIPKSAQIWGFSHRQDFNSVSFRNGEQNYEASFTDDEWNRYMEYKIVPTYIAYEKEVGYWRKEYDLSDAMYEEYKAQADLIQLVIQQLKHAETLSEELTNKDITSEINKKGLWVRDATINEVDDIIEQINAFGLEYMEKREGIVYNCGYHAMNQTMASLTGQSQAYKLLDRTNEILIYEEWY